MVVCLLIIVKANIKDKTIKETINHNAAHKRILEKLKSEIVEEEKKAPKPSINEAQKKDFRLSPKEFLELRKTTKTHNVFTEGKAAPSATSTALNLITENKYRSLTNDEVLIEYYNIVKSRQLKGYAKIQTNFGPLNFEIYSHLAPRAAENFLELLENGYYHHTKFHRLIPGFMIQGGDPEGTGMGGDSYFGGKFADEFTDKVKHTGRGILSMANSGPDANRSQLYNLYKDSFITFGDCNHLDNKHTIFGKLVGGMNTLDVIESVPTEKDDKPITAIEILDSQVFVNPFRDVIQELLRKEYNKKEKVDRKINVNTKERWFVQKRLHTESEEVGKYLKLKKKAIEPMPTKK